MKSVLRFNSKNTVGIVTTSAETLVKSANLYRSMVQYGYNFCKQDQDHPPTISVGIPAENAEDMFNNFNLAKHLGASFIATVDPVEKSLNETGLDILSRRNGEKMSEFAKRIFHASCDCDEQIVDNGGFCVPKKMSEIDSGLLKHASKFNIVGVIGGAGPIAGAAYCQDLTYDGSPYLALHDTTAPDKNNAILGLGPDFEPDYVRDIKLLDPFIKYLTIPCNTAHARRAIFEGHKSDNVEFVDIRDATVESVVQNYPSSKQVILLATPATIEEGLYHKKFKDAGCEIIVPNASQINDVYKAIYKVKGSEKAADEIRDPKDIILKVANDIRVKHGINAPVILGCTELPVPFYGSELNANRFVSTSDALAKLCSNKMAVSKANALRVEDDSGYSSDEEVGHIQYNWLDDLIDKYDVEAQKYGYKNKIRLFFSKKEEPSPIVDLTGVPTNVGKYTSKSNMSNFEVIEDLNHLKEQIVDELDEKKIRFHSKNRYITFDFKEEELDDLLQYLDNNNIEIKTNNEVSKGR